MGALSITGGLLFLQRRKWKVASTGPGGGGAWGGLHEDLAGPWPQPASFLRDSSFIPKREKEQFACALKKGEGTLHSCTGHSQCARSWSRCFIDMIELDITVSYTFAIITPSYG